MKKSVLCFALSFAVSLVSAMEAFGQGCPDPDSRDKSKYAVNNFENDEIYAMYCPYETVSVREPSKKRVKNVIFMIADGMGLEQLSAAWILNGKHLNITDNCTSIGLQWTYALNRLVTDSAAAGTALATGQKTDVGKISVSTDGKDLETLTELARKNGMKTGVSVVCRICDATPAVFSTHAQDRDSLYEITGKFVDSRLDFLSGGGLKWWENRPDGRNLTAEVRERGYTFVKDIDSLNEVDRTPVICLSAYKELPPALNRGDSHRRAVKKALELLPNKNGFFLMIEGSCIDDYSHANKLGYMAEEIFDFDRTVGTVLEWAEADGETLVIITGDHATGGMTLLDGSIEDKTVSVNYSSTGHNGVALPVFAWGPHSEDFIGIYENSELSSRIKKIISRKK